MQVIVLATRFVLELCLLGAFAVAGWRAGDGGVGGALLAVVLAAIGAGVWGVWIGPRSRRRLDDPMRFALEAVLFALGGLSLWLAWSAAAGAALAVGSVAIALLTRRVGEPAPGAWQ